jgi:hypothetical protein
MVVYAKGLKKILMARRFEVREPHLTLEPGACLVCTSDEHPFISIWFTEMMIRPEISDSHRCHYQRLLCVRGKKAYGITKRC